MKPKYLAAFAALLVASCAPTVTVKTTDAKGVITETTTSGAVDQSAVKQAADIAVQVAQEIAALKKAAASK